MDLDINQAVEQLQSSRYLLVASFSAISWDLIIHADQDLELIIKHRPSLSSVLYFISRLSVFGQALALIVLQVFSAKPCQTTLEFQLWLFAASSCSTSSLFLFRARAVYMGSKVPVLCFLVLWLLVLVSCVYTPFAFRSKDIGQFDGACAISETTPYCVACVVTSTVKDTVVFLAISWRLLSFIGEGLDTRSRINFFLRREALPKISGTLLQSGQQYYFFTIAANIIMMVMMHSRTSTNSTNYSFLMPFVVVRNSMACKVYRDVKLGLLVDDVPTRCSRWSADLRFAANPNTADEPQP